MPAPIQDGMKESEVYHYRPRGIKKEGDVRVMAARSGGRGHGEKTLVVVNIGFAKEAPDTDVSGICVYHMNRLVKPYWKVLSSTSGISRGIIGYVNVDYMVPARNKQVCNVLI